jgi:ubiquinone/menaquinone biosynthesis C-methylase UbiE
MNASQMSKREFFNRHAVSWDRQCDQDVASQIEELVQRFDLEEGKTVLDVGCGTGVLLSHLLKKVKEKGSVFALDFSWNMILEAKKNMAKTGIHFINGSVEALPLKDHTIDYLTCLDTFAHVTDQKKALYEMGRALKKGGKLFIAHTLGKKELAEYHRMAGAEVEHDTLPEDEKMREMMGKAGFKDIEIIDQPNLYLVRGRKFPSMEG